MFFITWQNQKGETFAVPVAQKHIKNGIVWKFKRQFQKEGMTNE